MLLIIFIIISILPPIRTRSAALSKRPSRRSTRPRTPRKAPPSGGARA